MKNSNDTIGNRTHDLPACSAVPQPTAPPRTPFFKLTRDHIPYESSRPYMGRHICFIRCFKTIKMRFVLRVGGALFVSKISFVRQMLVHGSAPDLV